jgi:hypothetical protein
MTEVNKENKKDKKDKKKEDELVKYSIILESRR